MTLYPATTAAEVAQRIQGAHVIISNKVHVDAEHMQLNPQLKLILISATGTDNVDLVHAQQQGIVVCNLPSLWHRCGGTAYLDVNVQLGDILFDSMIGRLNQGNSQKADQFCLLDFPIIELVGKTLGIIRLW